MKTIFRGKVKEGSIVRVPPFKSYVTLKFTYDFARDGGAISTISLKDELGKAAKIPDNAVIVNVVQESITTATSGGLATVAIGITGTTGKFLAATAFDDATFVAEAVTARNAVVPYKTTAAVDCVIAIATATLTAGKFNVYVNYYEGD